MPGRLGPRFTLEAIFLILIAVGAGFADLRAGGIALVMSIAWLLVAVLEYTTERLYATLPALRRAYYAPPPAPDRAAPSPITPAEPEVDAATIVVSPPPSEREIKAEPEPRAEPEPEAVKGERPDDRTLRPLEPRPKRRWFGLRRAEQRLDGEPDRGALPPRHVRLLAPGKGEANAAEKAPEIDAGEERKGRWRE